MDRRTAEDLCAYFDEAVKRSLRSPEYSPAAVEMTKNAASGAYKAMKLKRELEDSEYSQRTRDSMGRYSGMDANHADYSYLKRMADSAPDPDTRSTIEYMMRNMR